MNEKELEVIRIILAHAMEKFSEKIRFMSRDDLYKFVSEEIKIPDKILLQLIHQPDNLSVNLNLKIIEVNNNQGKNHDITRNNSGPTNR